MKFIFYSHKEYSDIWPIMFGQAEKYLKQYDKVLFTNDGTAPDDWDVLYYEESLPYQQRVLSCLNKLDDEVVVFHHEDMFLNAAPNHKTLKYFANIVESGKVSFIKLLRGGYVDVLAESEYPGLVISPQNMVFSIQPTICKKKNLETMYRETPGGSIWDFESNTFKTTTKENFTGCMAFESGDKKRGMHHYDSSAYPYIATGVVKGKWYTSDYPEMRSLLNEYEIDSSVRGEV
jgi:hypothetical protein